MRSSCLTSKMLAHSAVRLHADKLSLMNNYLQQCKTNPLITMGDVKMTHTDACFVQYSFVLLRAVCGLIIMQLFNCAQWDALLLLYPHSIVSVLLENNSAGWMLEFGFACKKECAAHAGSNWLKPRVNLHFCVFIFKQRFRAKTFSLQMSILALY